MNTPIPLQNAESDQRVRTVEQPAPLVPRSPNAPKHVLIVDDDEVVRSSLAAVLECEGYVIHPAADGEAAVRLAIQHQPDLVLLDLNMPKMDGWTAFTKLEGARPLLPVIVLTARPNQYKNAVKLGVDAFMEKPLNFPVLLRAIRKLTQEPPEKHIQRIINSGFVTRLLDSQTSRNPDKNASVLILDGDLWQRDSLAAALAYEGFCIEAVCSISRATEMLAHHHFRVMLVDPSARETGGWESIERLARVHPDLPMIVLEREDDISKPHGSASTATRVILKKPVDFQSLLQSIRSLTATSRDPSAKEIRGTSVAT